MHTTQTTATHTPGPWIVGPSSNPDNGTRWRDILSTGTPFAPSYVGESLEHDAQLIAAAPELLAAMEKLLKWAGIPDGHPAQPLRDSARAAIAKATATP